MTRRRNLGLVIIAFKGREGEVVMRISYFSPSFEYGSISVPIETPKGRFLFRWFLMGRNVVEITDYNSIVIMPSEEDVKVFKFASTYKLSDSDWRKLTFTFRIKGREKVLEEMKTLAVAYSI